MRLGNTVKFDNSILQQSILSAYNQIDCSIRVFCHIGYAFSEQVNKTVYCAVENFDKQQATMQAINLWGNMQQIDKFTVVFSHQIYSTIWYINVLYGCKYSIVHRNTLPHAGNQLCNYSFYYRVYIVSNCNKSSAFTKSLIALEQGPIYVSGLEHNSGEA